MPFFIGTVPPLKLVPEPLVSNGASYLSAILTICCTCSALHGVTTTSGKTLGISAVASKAYAANSSCSVKTFSLPTIWTSSFTILPGNIIFFLLQLTKIISQLNARWVYLFTFILRNFFLFFYPFLTNI